MMNASSVSVLSIGPVDEHQAALGDILRRSDWAASTDPGGRLACCSGVEAAIRALRTQRVPVVLCDDRVDWRQLLERLRELPDAPFVIVTSRLADDRLWSEALNLGAYDVLAKPFDSNEVTRVLTMAWNRWLERSTTCFRRTQGQQLMQSSYA
jgi:CheY-like chemotaxis protein